jgi:hypothetical protein
MDAEFPFRLGRQESFGSSPTASGSTVGIVPACDVMLPISPPVARAEILFATYQAEPIKQKR